MPKTGLKTFVYSFSVSLLTIFTVNGVYWHETNSSQTDLTIPSQNITLFLNRHADNPSIRPVPVKKIALTVLPAAGPAGGNNVLSSSAEPEIIMADTTDVLEIPLEFGDFSAQNDENRPRPQKIAAHFEQMIHNPPPPAAAPALPERKASAEPNSPAADNFRPSAALQKTEEREIPAVAAAPASGAGLKAAETAGNISDKSKKETAKAAASWQSATAGNSISDSAGKGQPGLLDSPPAFRPAQPARTTSTAEAEIPLMHGSQSLQAVKPIQDSSEKLPEPKAAPQPAPLMVAEADTDSGAVIPLQRVRDVWAGRNENIKVTDHGSPNQVALAGGNVPIKSMTSGGSSLREEMPQASPDEEEWEKMAEKVNSDSPWTVAKSAGKSRNNMLQNEKYYQADGRQIHDALATDSSGGDEIKVASETVKNLLIPIPEDILNDENLTPQLVSSKKPDDIRKEIEVEEKLKETVRSDQPSPVKKETAKIKTAAAGNGAASGEEAESSAQQEKDKKKTILNSLSSIFSSSTSVKEKSSKSREEGIFDNLRRKIAGRNKVKIMPTEMRLSFQPNRAEISGQTLRWIQAFAARAAEDDGMMIEIRIDGTSAMELQQKRLNLLHNILTNKGVEYSKINTVFTQREPNSFIIRTVRLSNTNTGGGSGNVNRATQGYYLQW